jgi:hypothetical protein
VRGLVMLYSPTQTKITGAGFLRTLVLNLHVDGPPRRSSKTLGIETRPPPTDPCLTEYRLLAAGSKTVAQVPQKMLLYTQPQRIFDIKHARKEPRTGPLLRAFLISKTRWGWSVKQHFLRHLRNGLRHGRRVKSRELL